MERIRKYTFQKVSSGRAENIEDFFHQVIEPQFQHTDCIKSLHKALLSYVNMVKPTFCLRLYGSYSKDKYHLLRRGFLTEYRDGTRLFFCDNTFTLLFAGFKIAGISFDRKDLENLLYQQKVKVGFGQTSEEKELCYYQPKEALRTNLNSKGWYQAHIKPVGYGYGNYDLRKEFPNPPRDEWNKHKRIRFVQEIITPEKKTLLKAHLLRLIHPFNSFLVPKRTHLNYEGNNIGEELELISYVQKYLKYKFPEEFREFDQLSFKYTFPECRSKIKDIHWFGSVLKHGIFAEKKINSSVKNLNTRTLEIRGEKQVSGSLHKCLKSIGKEIFVQILYPELVKNIDITYHELAQKYSKYSNFSVSSQKSRLSSARSILRNGLEKEALQLILNSTRIPDQVRKLTLQYLKQAESRKP